MKYRQTLLTTLFLSVLILPICQIVLAGSMFIGGVSFEVPAEWPETEASSPMRAAQYRIPKVESDPEDGELAVFFFGEGQGGDTNANIVRWQQQFETPEEETGKIEKKVINGVSVTYVHIEGTYNPGTMSSGNSEPKQNYAFHGAIISGDQGQIFLKLVGPRNTVASSAESFQKMLSSIQSTITS